MKKINKILFICFCFFYLTAAYAVDVPSLLSTIPTVANPGSIPQRFQQALPTAPKKMTAPIQQSASKAADNFGGQAAKIKFKLTRVVIKDNTVYRGKELEAIFAPSYNKTISLADLQNLVNQVTVKYRGDGYVLSRAILPPQTINKGVVEVQVIEGYISEVRVDEKLGWVKNILKRYAEPVLKSRPLKMSTLERSLLLMNDLPGVNAKAVLTPAEKTPAASVLTLDAVLKRAGAYLAYDNYGTRYLGPQEISGGAALNSVTLPGSSDAVSVMTVPNTQELQFYQYVHTNPVGNNGGKFTLGGSYTDTLAGFTLEPLDVAGRSQLLFVDGYYPIIRTRSKTWSIHSTFNYNNIESTILGQEFYNDLIRSLVIGTEVSGIDSWHGVNDAKLDLEKGFDIMGAVKHFYQSRPKGVPNYLSANVLLSRLQLLPKQFSFLAAAHGQYADAPLYASEQFVFGGPDWGRGYDPSEIIGDEGVGMKFELRRDSTYGKAWLNTVEYYAFYDAGIIWNRDGISLPPKQSATSTGLGARFTFIPQLTGNLFYAKPLTHSIATQVAMNKDPLKPRIFFQLIAAV